MLNHFLENNLLPEIFNTISFWSQNLYCTKIISLKTSFTENCQQKFLVPKLSMVAKSVPRKQVCTKNFHQKYFGCKLFMAAKLFTRKQVCKNFFINNSLGENFLWLQSHFPENRFHQNFFGEYFFWLHNHFLENRFKTKISIKSFLVENFLLQNHFLPNCFVPKNTKTNLWSKFVYG